MKQLSIALIFLAIAVIALATVAVVMINAGSERDAADKGNGDSRGGSGFVGAIQGLFKPEVSLLGPGDEQLAEGQRYDITWDARGVDTVSVIASGNRADFPGRERGRFNIVIADRVPADKGSVGWTVPLMDTVMNFRIDVKGYNRNDKVVASDNRKYLFRPDIFATRHEDGIYIDVRKESRQRLYVFQDDKLQKAYLTSGSRSGDYYPRNIHPSKAHDHDGVFEVTDKHPVWHSQLFDVDMFWAMRYWSGHFIHGTYPNEYDKLGIPASSGCNRLTKEQAKELYDMTPVGTRVEIIAK